MKTMTATNDALIERLVHTGNELSRVLKISSVCTCRYNFPYADSLIKRTLIQRCQRCIVLEKWEKVF